MTPSELKFNIEQSGSDKYFFTRSTMRFFGDTMKNYGCCSNVINNIPVWELYRKRPVKHGLNRSSYFDKKTFKRVFK